MGSWFERAFGGIADEARDAIAQARTELVDRGWFGRMTMPNPTGFPDRSIDEMSMPSPEHLRNLHNWLNPPTIKPDVGEGKDVTPPANNDGPDRSIDLDR